MRTSHPIVVHSFGTAIVVAVILGGGTQARAGSDLVVETLLLLTSLFVLITSRRRPLPLAAAVGTLGVLAAAALQLVPLPIGLAELAWPPAIRESWQAAGASASYGFVTTSLGATLSAWCTVAVAVVFFWACHTLDAGDRVHLLRYFFLGWVVHLSAGLMEAGLTRFSPVSGVLPYTFSGGFFANPNHFTLFLCCGVIFMTYALLRGNRFVALAGLAIVGTLMLAVGSRSGLILGTLAFLVSFHLAGGSRRILALLTLLVGSAALGLLLSGQLKTLATRNAVGSPDRLTFLLTTWDGIRDSWLLGTGYGTFAQIYQIYERARDITSEYVNHAHNDYVELVLEGGVVAAILLAAYLAFVAYAWSRRGRLEPASVQDHGSKALLVITIVLLHSLVDYPLRTWALLSAFVYANVVLVDCLFGTFAQPASRRSSRRRSRQPVPVAAA